MLDVHPINLTRIRKYDISNGLGNLSSQSTVMLTVVKMDGRLVELLKVTLAS